MGERRKRRRGEMRGQIKVDFYSSHIGHTGRELIYGKISRHSRGFRIPGADARKRKGERWSPRETRESGE